MKQKFMIQIALAQLAIIVAMCGGCRYVNYTIGLIPGVQDPAKKLVSDAFSAKNPDVRRRAIVKLTKRYDGMREPFLSAYAEFTKDDDPLIRSIAVTALGNAADMKYFDTIVNALSDKDQIVQLDAAKALATGKMVSDTGAPAELYAIATDQFSSELRAEAIKAIGLYKSDKTDQTLLKCIDEEDFTVRLAARQALTGIYKTDCEYDLTKWRKIISENNAAAAASAAETEKTPEK